MMRNLDIIFQVNHKKVVIHMLDDSYSCFQYMNDIKTLKNRVRCAININEENRNGQISSVHFISDFLHNPSYRLVKINELEFKVERLGDDKEWIKIN